MFVDYVRFHLLHNISSTCLSSDLVKNDTGKNIKKQLDTAALKQGRCTFSALFREQTLKWNEYVNIAVNRNLSNCENSPKKSFSGLQRDSNPWLLRQRCSALPAELWRPIHWRLANLLSSSTSERNETLNEMTWTAGIAFFRAIFAIAQIAIHCDGHILISLVFPQFTSFHSVFHSFHGLMNSINWPASSIWVFIAQLGEHCSVTQRPRVRIPLKPGKPFFGLFSQLLKLRFAAMVTYSFHLYSRSSHHFIQTLKCYQSYSNSLLEIQLRNSKLHSVYSPEWFSQH